MTDHPSSPHLAVLGAAPAFAEPLHVGRPNVGDVDAFLERLREILDRRWLTNRGPAVLEFERRIADFVEVPAAVAMCNATVALEIVARAAGLEGEVIVPAFTFVATAHALQWQQIRPVFCDIEEATHTIDPARIEELITPRTTGIIGVHLWGNSCDVEAIQAIADRHGLAVMYDAAHAFACARDGKMIGGNGLAEVFSFHATKFFNAFEGGAVVTRDEQLAERMRLMQNFGFRGYDDVGMVGTNGKMSEPSAAMGLASFDAMKVFIDKNVENFGLYRSGLQGIPGLVLREPSERDTVNYQYVVIDVIAEESALTRDELIAVLWAEGVIARRYFYPGVHRMEPYATLDPHAGERLPVTALASERVLLLPTGTAVDAAIIDRICSVIRDASASAPLVRRALEAKAVDGG
jgi:dTDP-4-amino-4,6-dideoxygalactose transaminase